MCDTLLQKNSTPNPMHLITIMNYRARNTLNMCKSWIFLAKRFNPEAAIHIFFADDIPEIRKFAQRWQDITLVKLELPKDLTRLSRGHTHHPAQDLRLALWRQLETMRITKFIYVDADAFILDSLAPWWNIIDSKPYIAIPECQRSSGAPRLNAGVHSYCDTTGFITYRKLIHQYRTDGKRILIEAGEQGLVQAYFDRIRYTYTHPAIGHEYNSMAKYCRVIRADDKEIRVISGKFPIGKKISRIVTFKKKDFCENWLWWDRPVKVKILHAFGGPGPGFKFWELPECQTLWKHCLANI